MYLTVLTTNSILRTVNSINLVTYENTFPMSWKILWRWQVSQAETYRSIT